MRREEGEIRREKDYKDGEKKGKGLRGGGEK